MATPMIPTRRAPTPPGEILWNEFLKPMGLSQVVAARRMGIPLNRLNEVIHGKRGITADTALRLAQLLGTSPQFWMNLQFEADLYKASMLDAKSPKGPNTTTHADDGHWAHRPGSGARRRLTDEEVSAAREAMHRADELRQSMLDRRGGVPLPESWPLIRKAREERAKRI
jgi:antitoxin HigA-1